ncbi:MarR family winged helix-turn-helix transcriptional regulator [Desmospora activa]|uniref:MarR family winged helix-turn-helix transcriptional regulator n=1 Tax=Desmospora activa TaxID=500615 RepID=UPI001FE4CB2B|nr:MarR family transcriptional regulator [Desmospora activa]
MNDHETAEKLMKSFLRFSKTNWQHQQTFFRYKPSEMRVLFCIKRGSSLDKPEMKVSEISKHLQVTPPTVTQLINELEGKGLVERQVDPADRRAVRIRLTEQGEAVQQEAEDAFLSSFQGLVAYLGEKESLQLSKLMSKATRYFHEQKNPSQVSEGEGE